jgi:hypothetical protein
VLWEPQKPEFLVPSCPITEAEIGSRFPLGLGKYIHLKKKPTWKRINGEKRKRNLLRFLNQGSF